MIAYEKVVEKDNASVVHPGHPPVIDTALLADKTKVLKAGTVLKLSTDGKTVEPAAEDDDPAAVLTKDSDGKNAEALVLWHGVVVAGRLLDSSGTEPKPAGAELIVNLRNAGIYPVQLFTNSKKG